MKTIAVNIIEKMESNGSKFIKMSSVWDVHNSFIGQSKISRVYKDVECLFVANKSIKRITAIAGSKGRNQDSAFEVLLFDTTNMSSDQEKEAGFIYQCDEFFSHEFVGGKPEFIQK